MEDKRNDFTKGKVSKAISSMGMPLVFAQVVNVTYSMVDRMYIGHISGVGTMALTGIGICTPLITIIAAFANMCGTGGGPLCSIERGKGSNDKAEQIIGNGFQMLVFFAMAITLLSEIFLAKLLVVFGASADSFPYAYDYSRIYLVGTIFSMLSLGLVFYINAQGFSRIGMYSVLIGAVVNVILDPVFIFSFQLGVRGAAITTVIAQFVSAVCCVGFLRSDKAILKLRVHKINFTIVKNIVLLGLSGFIISVTAGLVQVACNRQLGKYGGDIFVAAMTAIYSFREVVFNIIHGYTNGAQPVLGYNYGAACYGRVKEGIVFLTKVCLCYGVLVTAVVLTFPRQILSLYNNDPYLLEVGTTSLRLYFAGFFVLALQMVCQCLFVGLGMSKYSIFFAVLRKILIIVPLVYTLPLIPSIGANGVFLAELISDVVSGIICYIFMYRRIYLKMDGSCRFTTAKL